MNPAKITKKTVPNVISLILDLNLYGCILNKFIEADIILHNENVFHKKSMKKRTGRY